MFSVLTSLNGPRDFYKQISFYNFSDTFVRLSHNGILLLFAQTIHNLRYDKKTRLRDSLFNQSVHHLRDRSVIRICRRGMIVSQSSRISKDISKEWWSTKGEEPQECPGSVTRVRSCTHVDVERGLNIGSLVCRIKKAIMQMIHERPEEGIRLRRRGQRRSERKRRRRKERGGGEERASFRSLSDRNASIYTLRTPPQDRRGSDLC